MKPWGKANRPMSTSPVAPSRVAPGAGAAKMPVRQPAYLRRARSLHATEDRECCPWRLAVCGPSWDHGRTVTHSGKRVPGEGTVVIAGMEVMHCPRVAVRPKP